MSDAELVENLRRAAGIWFKNDDLLMLEELIRRYRIARRIADGVDAVARGGDDDGAIAHGDD